MSVSGDEAGSAPAGDGMTIEELAARAGSTTRNIRNYQTLGLLRHPTRAGRVGLYDEGHLARLRLIAQLQEHGFSLAGIANLLQAWESGRSLADVLGFEAALTMPWTDEQPEVVDPAELLEQFPDAAADPSLAQRSVEIGLLVPEGDKVRVPSPRLLRLGRELTAAGVPLAATMDELVALRADMDRVARRFVEMFDTYVWAPFAEAGMPAERLPQVTEALKRMRPAAVAAVDLLLAQAMDQRTAANTALRAAVGALSTTTDAGAADPPSVRAAPEGGQT